MAANANRALSTIVSSAEAVPKDLPVALVSRDTLGVKVQFGGDETIGATSDTLPFAVEKSNGKPPCIKVFGSLLYCDGGTLTIEGKRYRIHLIQQQENVADAMDTLASMLAEATAEKVLEKMEIASSSISFSTVKTTQYEDVTNLLRFKIKGATWKHKGRIPETNTQLHTWLDGNEDSPENIKGYMNYINEVMKPKFRWKEEHEYVDCNEEGGGLKSLLYTRHFDGQHSTSGNIDVVLVESADNAAMAIKNNIELGLELKHTKNKGEHEKQVVLQHLAASFLNREYPVLTLMTDLSTRFTFYWFGKNKKIIWKYKASIAEAMYLLDHMFVKNDAGRGDGDEEETFPIDFLIDDRGTWESFNAITAGRKRDIAGNPVGEKKEQMHQSTSSSGGRCIGNNYKLGQEDLSDVLGFDTLEEHEKGEAVLEYIACNVLPNVV